MKKFRTWVIVALCGFLGALTACSSGSSFVRPNYDFNSVGKVAVLISINAGNPAQQQEIADLFAMQVLQKGYDVIDRANLADLSNEAAFQNGSGITSPEARAKLDIHNVSAVIVVNVSTPNAYEVPPSSESYWVRGHWRPVYGGWVWEPGHWEVRQRPGYVAENGEDISMTAKMLDVQTGTLLWAGEGTGSLKSGLATFGGALLGAARRRGAGLGHRKRRAGAVIGGMAGALGGGVAGAALEENLAQLMRSVIEKTCRGLPARAQVGRIVSEPAPVSSSAGEAPAAAPAAAGAPAVEPPPMPANPELTWPRSVKEGAATLTMYQPKIQKWSGNEISCQAAVSIEASEPIYGVASLSAAAELNKADRTVTFSDFQVTKVSFPTAPDKEAQYLDGFRKLAPAGGGRCRSTDWRPSSPSRRT